MSTQLTLMCGLPGAGKSTMARELEASESAVRLAVDEWILALGLEISSYETRRTVESLQLEVAAQVLLASGDVILDWGFWHRKQRNQAREVARRLGSSSRIFVWPLRIEEFWGRIETRNRAGGSPLVTRDQLVEWAPYFEPLDQEEASLFDEVVWM